jgi:5-formyltetrahydrofolate cyclo-ligase
MMTELDQQKKALRAEMMQIRKSLSASKAVLPAPKDFSFLRQSQTLAAYWPMAGELDVRPFMENWIDLGKACCLPVVHQKDSPLIFRQWQRGEALEEGPHKTCHPFSDKPQLLPDVVLVPLLAFDLNGGRLGYGGGYYDRTLAGLDVLKIGVGFDEQETHSVPMGPFDQKLDWIITPTRAIECASFK